jgi:HSP90 family molecular chaperone
MGIRGIIEMEENMELKDIKNDSLSDLSLEEVIALYSRVLPYSVRVRADFKAELLRRFGELEARDEVWRNKYATIQDDLAKAWKQTAALQKQVEDMACCSNCCNTGAETERFIFCRMKLVVKRYCDSCDCWQSDGLTHAERMKG